MSSSPARTGTVRSRLRLRLAAAPLALLALGSGALAGCGGRGAALGTTSSACFHALPPAVSSLHHRGRLVGVRLMETSRLRGEMLRVSLPAHQKVCLVAFSGAFSPADVKNPVDQQSGEYVVVAVRPDGSEVLASLVTHRLPLPFRHSHSL